MKLGTQTDARRRFSASRRWQQIAWHRGHPDGGFLDEIMSCWDVAARELMKRRYGTERRAGRREEANVWYHALWIPRGPGFAWGLARARVSRCGLVGAAGKPLGS